MYLRQSHAPQILDGQIFLGCEFPCAEGYRAQLHEYGKKVGEALAAHGAMERFAMDFVTVQQPDGSWECPAVRNPELSCSQPSACLSTIEMCAAALVRPYTHLSLTCH